MVIMFGADASAGGQRRDLNHSPGPISETRPASGHRSIHGGMDDGDGLDGYINNTLAQKFSDLTFDDPPLAPYICPKPESSSVRVLMLIRGQRSLSRSVMLMPSNLGPPAAANIAHVLPLI